MNIATILAAGLGSRFGDITKYVPKGMIKIGAEPMIESSIEKLLDAGYSKIILVTGHCSDVYDNFTKKWDAVDTIKNPFYNTTGSLFSLYLAMSYAKRYQFNNLTILESDIIYDSRILKQIPSLNCMLTSKPKRFDIGDECWVEMDKHERITSIVKDPKKIKKAELEMVGISNISMNTIENVNEYERMLNESLQMLSENNMEDYEQLLASNKRFVSEQTIYEWAEMDNVQHMEYAIENVLSKLK